MYYSSIYATLCLLAASAGLPLCFVAAENNITTDDLYTKIAPTAALPGFNVEGGSVFTNYVDAFNKGQLFFIRAVSAAFERPASEPVRISVLNWCSDLTFSDVNNNSLIGYAGRCVEMISAAGFANLVASEAQLPYDFSKGEFTFTFTSGISAVFVEQQNVFEGQFHANADSWVARYWDDGRKTSPYIIWKGHDEGDMSPNAATSSFSGVGERTWMSVEEVAHLFNVSVDEFTPEKFKQAYLDTWIKDHEFEAANANPNPGPELEIIEQVKNEFADETTAQPDSTAVENGGSDAANPVVEEDDSGSGRQLTSVAVRFVSAALRVFGI